MLTSTSLPQNRLKEYQDVWRDLRTLSQHWKRILVPTAAVFDMGASEAVHGAIPRELVLDRPSPVIFMRAQKNEVEKQGMKKAHIRDGAAMCEVLSFLEDRVSRLKSTDTDLKPKPKPVVPRRRSLHGAVAVARGRPAAQDSGPERGRVIPDDCGVRTAQRHSALQLEQPNERGNHRV